MRRAPALLTFTAALLALTACAGPDDPFKTTTANGQDMLEAKVIDTWALTVDEGSIECWRDSSVTFLVEDTRYAVNGRARGQLDERGWVDILEIGEPSGDEFGTSVDVLDFVDYATTVCPD